MCKYQELTHIRHWDILSVGGWNPCGSTKNCIIGTAYHHPELTGSRVSVVVVRENGSQLIVIRDTRFEMSTRMVVMRTMVIMMMMMIIITKDNATVKR